MILQAQQQALSGGKQGGVIHDGVEWIEFCPCYRYF
jgi:hypothetical protein